MVTISDVAAKAGVSRATVSYVLNSNNTSVRISEETRKRVLNSAEELGYRRNELARAVITGKNRMLGIWVMQSNREPVVRVLAGAMKEADANDYFIKLIGFDKSLLDKRALERCVEWRLSGIVAIHTPESTVDTLYPQILETGIPFVMVDSQKVPPGCPHIVSDSSRGMELAVEHLIELGHRKIACIGGEGGPADFISNDREAAYRGVMARYGLEHECRCAYGEWNEEPTTAAARSLLSDAANRPTAIACMSDHAAMITIRTATEMGLKVPGDLSVTGFDDIMTAGLYNPSLTTVAQSFEEMGRRAVQRLINPAGKSDGRATTESDDLLPVRLVQRSSSAPVQA